MLLYFFTRALADIDLWAVGLHVTLQICAATDNRGTARSTVQHQCIAEPCLAETKGLPPERLYASFLLRGRGG